MLLHRAIVTLQLFELTSHGFAVIYRFRHAGRSADQGSTRAYIDRNENASPHFAVGNIRFFVAFFLIVFFFDFIPILVLAFIAAQTAAALSQ